MTASCDISFPIRLEALAVDQPRFCSYEPELFPGLVYRMYSPKVRTHARRAPHAHTHMLAACMYVFPVGIERLYADATLPLPGLAT
jgi:hypothetical protein